MTDHLDLKKQILEAARMLLPYMTKTYHGNISARVPNTDIILLTARSYLHETLSTDDIVEVSLTDDTGLEALHPSSMEIINMHRIIYEVRQDVGAVIHTHSPGVTGYAIANEEIPCAYEAMVRHGITEPIKVASYAPRGSDESIRNIQEAMGSNKAVLLGNHGILAFEKNPVKTAGVIVVLEESAEMYISAKSIGQIQPIPQELIAETITRKEKFSK